mgnify:CR=1 FL=1
MLHYVFFLMIRRPPRSTLDRSSAASDVYKRQDLQLLDWLQLKIFPYENAHNKNSLKLSAQIGINAVSYTHLRAHETVLDLVCRLLLEKKKQHLHYHVLVVLYTHDE